MDVFLNGKNLTIDKVVKVACHFAHVRIASSAILRVLESSDFIKTQVEKGAIVYGVTTGFGPNADTVIPSKDAVELQHNLLISHATGVGVPLDKVLTRAMMVIRLNTLLAGHSGIRLQTIQLFQSLLNYQIHPIIPIQGSVGASGDLCPQSHMALPVIGVGEVEYQGKRMLTSALYNIEKIKNINRQIEAKNKDYAPTNSYYEAPIRPIKLSYKEGLAFNNGTALMAALGVLGTYRAHRLLRAAIASASMVYEALCARTQAFEPYIHAVRRHESQQLVAGAIRSLTHGSTLMGLSSMVIIEAIPLALLKMTLIADYNNTFPEYLHQNSIKAIFEKENLQKVFEFRPKRFIELVRLNMKVEDSETWKSWDTLVHLAIKKLTPQDAYSVRCAPQVLGASLEAIRRVERTIAAELNAVVDNPIIFLEGQQLPNGDVINKNQVLSGGNFHGQPLALVLDHLKVALAEIGSLLERQVNKLVDKATNEQLPAFLAEQPGLHSGLMIPQYVAAALVSENKSLSHPASVDSIPTSANQEDHVSMGPIAGRQALEILGNVEKILAIHLITGKQALQMRLNQFENKLTTEISINAKNLIHLLENAGISYYDKDRLLYLEIEQVIGQLDKIYDEVDNLWKKSVDDETAIDLLKKELEYFDISHIDGEHYLIEDVIRLTEKIKRLKQLNQ